MRWPAVACAIAFAASLAAPARAASELPARVIVKLRAPHPLHGENAQQLLARQRLRPSDAAVASLSSRAGAPLSWVKALADGSHVFAPEGDGGVSGATLAARLRHAPEVAWTQVDTVVSRASGVSDPHYSSLWALEPPTVSSFGADFAGAWALHEAQADVRAAIIDTGVLPHPDLIGPSGAWVSQHGALASEGYDFISDCRIRATCPASTPSAAAIVAPQPQALDQGDWISDADRATAFFSGCAAGDSSWHGTHTAGTVAALANNGIGIAGGAYGAKLVPVRVLGKCGGYMSDVVEAIRWAAGVHPTIPNPAPARIVNLSLGAAGTCEASLQSAIDAATAAGALVVAAAGNESSDAAESMLPSCSNVLVAAASTASGDLAYYSNYSSTRIALAAPGGDMRITSSGGILSLSNTGAAVHDPLGWRYTFAQGTSSAAPHVTAAAAAMLSRNGALNPSRIRSILTLPSSLTPFPVGSRCATIGGCGAGLLNAQRAVANAASPLKPSIDDLDFGSLAMGESASLALELLNESSGATSIGTAAFNDAAELSLSADECSGRTLAAFQTCRLEVTLAPTTEGTIDRTLQVPTSSANEGRVLTIRAMGIVGSRLTSATPIISLGVWTLGETRRVSVRFAPRYHGSLHVKAVHLSDLEQAAIAKDECSNADLSSGVTCEVEVVLTGVRSGPLNVRLIANTDGSGDLPFAVSIQGEVAAPSPAPAPPGDSGSNDTASSPTNSSSSPQRGGGGGAFGPLMLLILAVAAAGRRAVAAQRSARPNEVCSASGLRADRICCVHAQIHDDLVNPACIR